ncbi:hypothetical protein HYPSUDRAFT_139683, partial [Hypholoma sublateritium FD-334 SS-4]
AFANYAPKLYADYQLHLDTLFSSNLPNLDRLFPAHVSVFPTAAFNVGPNVWTYKHRDTQNLPYGWCAIHALGSFDPTKGGHLILWEPRLIIEFPPGALIFIPSAVITHSNVPISEGETRSSFTQYAPGGLFRFVDAKLHLMKDLATKDPEHYQKMLDDQPYRWRRGLGLLSTIDEIRK